jgi:hypothetical protein
VERMPRETFVLVLMVVALFVMLVGSAIESRY